MGITGTEDISLVRKEVKESQSGSILTTKTLIFKHEAGAGDLVIDTTALSVPSEALANGFVQDNPSSLNLLLAKKNLKIHSSRGLWLQMHEDFKVVGANLIQLIGSIKDTGGALEGEVFTIYANTVQSNAVLTTDHKRNYQEYLLAEGQTVLNLGREYEVNRNPGIQIGAIRVFRNGAGPLLRNVGNAAADPLADGNYQEIEAAGGIGTTIEFNVAPSGQDDVIVVEFGLEYAGDFSLVGDIDALYGAILKLADDVKDLGPYDITRYINANPSQIERRAFGDMVLLLNQIVTEQFAAPGFVLGGASAKRTDQTIFTGLEFFHNAVPIISQGDSLLTVNYTPRKATSKIIVEAQFTGREETNTSDMFAGAIFVNGAANAVISQMGPESFRKDNTGQDGAVVRIYGEIPNSGGPMTIEFRGGMITTSGGGSSNWALNQIQHFGGSNVTFGANVQTFLRVIEVNP